MLYQTFALKRYWLPLVAGDQAELYPWEGDIYESLDNGRPTEEKHVFASHNIKIGGELDTTFTLIRQGLDGTRLMKEDVAMKPSREQGDPNAETSQHVLSVADDGNKSSPPELVNRCHVNILMRSGYSLTEACSIPEYLKVFKDIAGDHRDAYKLLFLHRDVSAGNLLIFEHKSGETFGRLIDYDHAKKATKKATKHRLIDRAPSKQRLVRMLLEDKKKDVDDDVISNALTWIKDTAAASLYIVATVNGLVKPATSPLSKAALGWDHGDDETKEWPDFDDRLARPNERTGTLPYMSGEVIAHECLFILPGESEARKFVHEAIHDMESLFWVLIHTCITRKGPGIDQKRAEDLKSTDSLRETVVKYFDAPREGTLEDSKRDLLLRPSTFTTSILNHFHPRYDCLKDLAQKWLDILILGYKYRGDEFYNIHSHIVRILEEARVTAEQEEMNSDELLRIKKELRDKREGRKENLLNTFKEPAAINQDAVAHKQT
ncbi:hypothetical protein C0991_006443 [Blastosporella zonata]|nr:hypothetical protein C0991_006443 [Blastosporella zonata]